MATRTQHRLQVSPASTKDSVASKDRCRTQLPVAIAHANTAKQLFDFAVGFSRQPLPKGNRFAIVTNAGGPGIMATDAATRYGLELAKLRPETLESLKAKLPPTANSFHRRVTSPIISPFGSRRGVNGSGPRIGRDPQDAVRHNSMAEDARAGFKKITNGVKQELPGAWLLGLETQAVADVPVLLAELVSTS